MARSSSGRRTALVERSRSSVPNPVLRHAPGPHGRNVNPVNPASHITITVASAFVFTAKLLTDRAPHTCAAFTTLLPYRQRLIHARWSGEACWIPLGDYQLGVGYENHTSHPSRGDLLWYPGGVSETELLFAYGSSLFASKMGQLAGNHFLEIVEGRERLEEMGRHVLYHGAQDIVFEAA